MKVLIIDENQEWRKQFCDSLEQSGHTVEVAEHEDALATFMLFEPKAILVCDYLPKEADEKTSDSFNGRETYQDIKTSALEDQHVFRCGVYELEHEDYFSRYSFTSELTPIEFFLEKLAELE